MVTVNSCRCKDCVNYEDGKCDSFYGIDISEDGECMTFEPDDEYEYTEEERENLRKYIAEQLERSEDL